ncbi:MAG: CoB--CoM heterodisulfide reductase iron-sulfur subunit B family protein [Anaerolineae bacterium]|nr:CoB--CoM heterodisulfide reductase iron-sulfur subunit B family protein [Anaerolineae bacterium]
MRYFYYPGCSMSSSALEYDVSARAVLQALGAEVVEVEDWTCCGASAAETLSFLLSLVLPARNLALAEGMDGTGDFLVGCSACYTNHRKVAEGVREDPRLLDKINAALSVENLAYAGRIRVRHLLDVLANDFGPEAIAARVKKSLARLSVAPYYGCQTVRPYSPFDDDDYPMSMDEVLAAAGADVFPYDMKAKCCSSALMTTKKEVALELVGNLLRAAKGADCIATVCPMCQLNLEAYQDDVSRHMGEDLHIPVLYLTQLLGLAFDLPRESLKLERNMTSPRPVLDKLGGG